MFGTEPAALGEMCVRERLPLKGVRVLVVEDDPQGAKLLRIVLEQAGAIVTLVASARQVQRRLRTFDAELVLLDLALPEQDGFTVLKALRKRVERRALTVVVISSMNGLTMESALEELGCAAYFSKPIETSTLAANLARYLEGGHGRGGRSG